VTATKIFLLQLNGARLPCHRFRERAFYFRRMNFFHTALLAALLGQAGLPPQGALPLTRSERAALAYLRTQPQHPEVCVSPQRQPVSVATFQSELAARWPLYTMAYLFAVDSRESLTPRPAAQPSACAYEVVFPKHQLDHVLVCEVFPHGDRTFIASEVYLFQVKRHKVVFVSKKAVNYN
jgi:hypothetical protein